MSGDRPPAAPAPAPAPAPVGPEEEKIREEGLRLWEEAGRPEARQQDYIELVRKGRPGMAPARPTPAQRPATSTEPVRPPRGPSS